MFWKGSVGLPGFNFADGFRLRNSRLLTYPGRGRVKTANCAAGKPLTRAAVLWGGRGVCPGDFGMRKAPGGGPLGPESAGSRQCRSPSAATRRVPGRTLPGWLAAYRGQGGAERGVRFCGRSRSPRLKCPPEGKDGGTQVPERKKGRPPEWRSCPSGRSDYLDLQRRTEKPEKRLAWDCGATYCLQKYTFMG